MTFCLSWLWRAQAGQLRTAVWGPGGEGGIRRSPAHAWLALPEGSPYLPCAAGRPPRRSANLAARGGEVGRTLERQAFPSTRSTQTQHGASRGVAPLPVPVGARYRRARLGRTIRSGLGRCEALSDFVAPSLGIFVFRVCPSLAGGLAVRLQGFSLPVAATLCQQNGSLARAHDDRPLDKPDQTGYTGPTSPT